MRIIKIFTLGLVWAHMAAACGDDEGITPASPYEGIPVSETVQVSGLLAPVDVVRDQYGVAHIHAQNISDLAFVSGYIQAEERLQQMDLFRRFASGSISEMFGALDPAQIDGDLEMRMHRMRPIAEEAWQELMSSSDPSDQELVLYMNRFTEGINRYAEDLKAGRRQIDPAQSFFFDPQRFTPWTPVDTLAIGRLQAFSLSFDGGGEIHRTERLAKARELFDQADPQNAPELARRAGAAVDLYPIQPMDPTATIDGFPNTSADTGTRARDTTTRPSLPTSVLEAARNAVSPRTSLGRRLRDAFNGSNNWVVGPDLAGGSTLLANDPHLSLASPSIFYLTHLTVPGDIDMAGITFPGIPGIILGHNHDVAWGSTTVMHDVTDYYREEIVPCSQGGGDCVMWKGQEVAIETRQETVQIGALGTITDSKTVTYEFVPHHGPILPVIENHDIVPRQGNTAISVRYTGHELTNELKTFQRLWRVRDRAEAFDTLNDFGFGAQNWVFIDKAGSIGWTSMSRVPTRTAECFGFHATEAPDGLAPFLVLPGDGTCEWDGWLDARYIPHAVDPEAGFLATANADPVGQTFDGDPLNGPLVDGRPLYAGVYYDEGFRVGRITRNLQARADSGVPMTMDDMAEIQADTYSSYGERMRPHILAATQAFAQELAQPGTHPDLQTWIATLTVDRQQAIMDAAARLESWSLETPAAVEGMPSPQAITDSTATSIFNIWVVYALRAALDDELTRLGEPGQTLPRAFLFMLERPQDLVSGLAPETGQPILCDNLDTPESIESCTLVILMALDQALEWARGDEGFATASMDEWRWGKLHTLTLYPLVPAEDLQIPPASEPDPLLRGGYPRPGDGYSVDASHPGYNDLDFSYNHGPAMRHITEFTPDGKPITRMALPGGQSSHRDSGHFRDLMDEYWSRNEYFRLPWTIDEIIAAAETRRRFEPAP